MKPPIFSVQATGSRWQQYLHVARMFRAEAMPLMAYVNGEQNWPRYALMLHACELVLKAFCDRAGEAGQQAARVPNHDLRGWYNSALECGLPADQQVEVAIETLAELHRTHYARYPDNRSIAAADLSDVVDDVVDRQLTKVAI